MALLPVQFVSGSVNGSGQLTSASHGLVAGTVGNTWVAFNTRRGAAPDIPSDFAWTEHSHGPITPGADGGRMIFRPVDASDTTAVKVVGALGGRSYLWELPGLVTPDAESFTDVDTLAQPATVSMGTINPTADREALILGGIVVHCSDWGGNDDTTIADDPNWTRDGRHIVDNTTDSTEPDVADTSHPLSWAGHRAIPTTSGSYPSSLAIAGGGNNFGGHGGLAMAFLGAVVEPEPGIVIDVHDPDGVFIATLDDAIEKQIKPMLNGTGVGSFKLNRYSPHATPEILKGGNLVKVTIPRIDPNPIFSFFLEDEGILLVSDKEKGGEVISVTGNGGLSYLARAVWLAASFVIDWWPATMADPPAGTRGAVVVKPGSYRRYTIAGGVITGYVNFTTATGFSAYFDSRQTYQWPSENSKRFLVHLTTTEDPSSPSHVGHYFHPHQDGVKEYLPSYALNTQINLTDIGDGDKPGQVLYRMCQEAVAAGRPTHPVPLLTVDFTDTTDSNGDPWTTTDALVGVTADLGETYLETLGKLLGTGVLDVVMGVDLVLHAYNHFGRDLTGTSFGTGVVRFAKGINIADQLARQRRPEPVATWIQVVGTNDVVAEAELPDAASRIPRETSIRGETDNEAALEALGLAELERQLVASDAIAFKVTTLGGDPDTGKYLPGPEGSAHGDYWIGDLATLHTGTADQDFNEADERIVSITIAEVDAGNLEVTPEVGATLDGGNGLLRSAGSDQLGVVGTTIAQSGSGEPVTISEITDIPTAETDTSLVLKPNGAGGVEWGVGSGSLDDLSDVVIATAAAGDRLRFDGSTWRNSPLTWKPVMDGLGNVLTDSGTGDAIMAEVAP